MYGRLGASRNRASRRFPSDLDLSPTCHTNGTVRSRGPGSVASVADAGVVTWRSRRRADSPASPRAGSLWSVRSAGAPRCTCESPPGHFSGPHRCGALARALLGHASDCHSSVPVMLRRGFSFPPTGAPRPAIGIVTVTATHSGNPGSRFSSRPKWYIGLDTILGLCYYDC
jgi:hypothetical protein